MNPITRRWGIWGAVALGSLGGSLVFLQLFLPYSYSESVRTSLYGIVWDGICYPVALGWEAMFRAFGVKGDARMIYIFPVAASTLLYFACLGFGIGVVLRRVVRAT
jgi:hypothetical protein